MAGEEEEREVIHTPSWAIATICAIFVVAGVTIVFIIDQFEKWLKRMRKKPLVHAINKMKEELLQLGFISLLLVLFQNDIEHLCIRDSVLTDWNACSSSSEEHEEATPTEEGHGRRLMGGLFSPRNSSWWSQLDERRPIFRGRVLAEGGGHCSEGHSPMVSLETLHQLHIYLFLLASVHIFYTVHALLISAWRMRRMKAWEAEAQQSQPHEVEETIKMPEADRNRSFVQHHLANPLSRNTYSVWIVCFFRQFIEDVTKSDYFSLRQGFITTHDLGHQFDFRGYLLRSLEVEFPKVVGITPVLWAYFILLLAFNVHGVHLYFWVSLVPAFLVLAVGTKLQHVIATLALDSAGVSHHGQFANKLAPRDSLFWFNRPGIILVIIHYIIFQNAFELTNFLSYIWAFGFNSCLLAGKAWVFSRLAISILTQIMVCYHTLPLYAVVIQMGSHASPALFNQQVRDRLRTWRKDARKRARMRPIYEEGPEINGESVLGEKFDMDGPNYEDLFNHPRSRSAQDRYKPFLTSKYSLKDARVTRSTSEPIPDVLAMMQLSSSQKNPQRTVDTPQNR